jgi:hypothetical protein
LPFHLRGIPEVIIIANCAVETVPGTVAGQIAARFTDYRDAASKEVLCKNRAELERQCFAFARECEEAHAKYLKDLLDSPEGRAVKVALGMAE